MPRTTPILVASLADHSLPASERTAAEALVAACSQCADLHADLAGAAGRDPGDADSAAADRLHADPGRRGPAPVGRLAPLRGDPRDARATRSAGRWRSDSRRSVWPACSWPRSRRSRWAARRLRPGACRCAGRRRRGRPRRSHRRSWVHRRRPKAPRRPRPSRRTSQTRPAIPRLHPRRQARASSPGRRRVRIPRA